MIYDERVDWIDAMLNDLYCLYIKSINCFKLERKQMINENQQNQSTNT